MNLIKSILIYTFILVSFNALSSNTKKKGQLINLHKVNDNLYRADQPNSIDMIELEKKGIKTVLNLRNHRNDKREGKPTQLTLIHYPINAWRMSYKDIISCLKIINKAEKPILVHCTHGSDRTGSVIAAYRMAIENWTSNKAIEEFLTPKYGYHAKWFPKMLELLKSIDTTTLQADLKN